MWQQTRSDQRQLCRGTTTRVRRRHSIARVSAEIQTSREARSLLLSRPVMRKRKNIARGTQPAKPAANVGAVPLPIRFETVTKITKPVPLVVADDFGSIPVAISDEFIGEDDTIELVA
jgi:hypothetical protein